MYTEFVGRRLRVFWLALKTGFFTVLTLGIYRFWMKTRLRRWYWSAIRPGGTPLEYVGDPFEKLLGFLIAVVILAFYIGIVNLFLMFASFSLFQGNFAAYALSLVGVIPIWFYAKYRARRYILARTRWRGLRFGQAPGAWSYAARAIGFWILTIVSAGLLWPLMTFRLEKFKADRTFFGTARLEQGGKWTMLYGSLKPVFVALLFGLGAAAAIATSHEPFGIILAAIGMFIGLYGLVYYRVDSFKRLTNAKSLNGMRFSISPSTTRVIVIYALGTLIAGTAILVPATALGVMIVAIQSAETIAEIGFDPNTLPIPDLNRWALVALSVALYFTIFLLWSALSHAFITMPLVRHYCASLRIENTDALRAIRQRLRDEMEEAEGFADALDVGASI